MSRWISIKDRLPEDRQRVLCYHEIRREVYLMTFCVEGNDSWFIGSMNNFYLKDDFITDWMPVPSRPKREKNK